MLVIFSPAKTMIQRENGRKYQDLPRFLDKTEELLQELRKKSAEELKALWKCSEPIAKLNRERLDQMDLRQGLTPALLTYDGTVFQQLSAEDFSEQDWAYAQEHFRILSGFYGLLRPLDGIRPYRLEMQTGLSVGSCKNLYQFWGELPAQTLCEEGDCILNLASKEYSKAVEPWLPEGIRFLSCVFLQRKGDRLVEQSTACKKARGQFLRFLVERKLSTPEELKSFNGLGYRFSPQKSDEKTIVFIQEG